jgi:hypothetical protein
LTGRLRELDEKGVNVGGGGEGGMVPRESWDILIAFR